MGEGRLQDARERVPEGPAISAGPSVSGARTGWKHRFTFLARPAISPQALASYRLERRTELTFPVASALMEGGFIGVIADKIYHVPPFVLALIVAAPMFGLLSSFVWARIGHGRRKIPLLVGLQAVFVLCTAGIALLPDGAVGGSLLVVCLITARLSLGGMITLRSLVWTLNYPREARARVTSRLQAITIATMTVTSLVGGSFLDATPESFRAAYAVGALLAVFGVLAFSRVKLIDEEEQLSLERGGKSREEGQPASVASVFGVLRRDPLFARYQLCQMTIGIANMMVEAPLIYLVSRELQASYTVSIALTLAIPLSLSLLTLPFWAAYIDRVHISEFRATHSWLWVIAQALTCYGAIRGSLFWIGAGRVVVGIGRGGGSLAWQLGHNDFAERENVGLYMGAHVTLTGIRGAFAPFLGMLLYVGWSAGTLGGFALPGFDGLGGVTIGISAGLSTAGTLGFWLLHRKIRASR